MKRRTRLAPLLLCLTLGATVHRRPASSAATTPPRLQPARDTAAAGEAVKIGFITKFPVDFYDTMVDAAKAWNEDHPEVELIFAQGESGTDDEGEIAAIESMVTQGVQAIAITPTSPNVQDALQEAVDEGIKVILVDNDIPGWDGKTSLVATDNLAGGVLAGEFLAEQLEPGDTVAVLEGVAGAPSLEDRVDRLQGGPRRRLRDRRLAADRLRPDQGPRRRPGHPHRQPRRHGDLRGLRPADHRRHRGDRQRRQGRSRSSASTPARTRSPPSSPATSSPRSPSSPPGWASSGAQAALDAINGEDVEANIDTGTEIVTTDNAAEFGG